MPRPRKNPGEPMDCSKRSITPFQTYVNHLITKKPEKIKALLARALMNDDSLMDFNGQIHANECVFSYPDSNWYSVYLMDKSGKIYWGKTGAQKFYFQMDFKMEGEIPVDAVPINGTLETPKELMVGGVEIKNCVIRNGKCANPEAKQKKKKVVNNFDDEPDEEETSEEVLASLSGVPLTAGGSASGKKEKMPRTYFESLGSKSLIIDWMIANMKPDEIFKCIQRGSLSAEDVQQAQSILDTMPSGGVAEHAGPSGMTQQQLDTLVQSYTPAQIHSMIKVVTKEEIVNALSRIKDPLRKRQTIISTCKRCGIKKYSLTTNAKGKPILVDEDGDIVDINEVMEECAEREAYRIKKLLKINSIAQDVKQGGLSKQDLINYRGGNEPLPYGLMASVKRHFPLIRKYKNQDGLLYGSIPSEINEDGSIEYYVIGDILGKDLRKLETVTRSEVTKQELMSYRGGNQPLPYSLIDFVKLHFPLIKKYKNQDGLLYGSIPSEINGTDISYYVVGDILGKDLRKLDNMMSHSGMSFGRSFRKSIPLRRLKMDLRKIKK